MWNSWWWCCSGQWKYFILGFHSEIKGKTPPPSIVLVYFSCTTRLVGRQETKLPISVSQGEICTVWAQFASSEEKRSGKLQNRRLSCKKNETIILGQYLEESFTVSAPVPPTGMEIFLPVRHTNPSNVSLSQNVLHFPPRSPPWTHGTKPSLLCLH